MQYGRKTEQLNTASAPEEFTLESIVREFGGSGGAEKRENAPRSEAEKAPDTASKTAPYPIVAGGKPDAPSRSDTKPLPTVFSDAEAKPASPPRIVPLPGGKPPAKKAKKPKAEKAKAPPPASPQELLTKAHSGIGMIRLRMALLLVIALLMLLPTAAERFSLAALHFPPASVRVWIDVALFSVAMLLALEVNMRGIIELVHFRFGLFTPAVAAAILALADTVLRRGRADVNFCPVVIVLYFFLLRAVRCEKNAMRRTLRAVGSFSAPMGVFDTPQLIKNTASLRRDIGKVPDFMEHLLSPDDPQRIFRVYGAVILPLSCGFALLLSRVFARDFVRSWLLLLLGAIPVFGAMSYFRPFARLAKRLSARGGALCGWYGAKIFGGRHTIILRDEDLFPKSSITSNGMKIYGPYKPARIIAYALAALNAANSPLVDLFETLLQSRLGTHYPVADHKFYDIGGIGAEIFDDIVLVGSLSFMRSMGVYMPEGTRVRQAVYVSVNGELAGVFALKYKANHSTKLGLRSILTNRRFSVVAATRDFLITPSLISAKYGLSTAAIRFPDYRERLRLSDSQRSENHRQGALIAKDTFGAFATTVAAGNTLRLTARFSTLLSLFTGVFGLSLCFFLLFWGGESVLTPVNVLLFQLIWAAVNGFLSEILLNF